MSSFELYPVQIVERGRKIHEKKEKTRGRLEGRKGEGTGRRENLGTRLL